MLIKHDASSYVNRLVQVASQGRVEEYHEAILNSRDLLKYQYTVPCCSILPNSLHCYIARHLY